jgi:hypothetical protein
MTQNKSQEPVSDDIASILACRDMLDAQPVPPRRTEQEPVVLPCCGYTDASAVKWNPFNGVVQCHNCGQCYTTPPQRTWVGLTDEEISMFSMWLDSKPDATVFTAIEARLKELNT